MSPHRKSTGDCVGKYEYMPDESWEGDGTCTYTYKGGDKVNLSWEEGSHLKETRTRTPAARANTGTPVVAVPIEDLTDTLLGGKYRGTIELP
jgi:hypothetical protein